MTSSWRPQRSRAARNLPHDIPLLLISRRLACSRCGERKSHCRPEPYMPSTCAAVENVIPGAGRLDDSFDLVERLSADADLGGEDVAGVALRGFR
jgi:hypothetical protein